MVISFIHKKNKYQIALIAAKTEAENYSQLQERFLANMSHEIRTTMNAIAGFTEQLLKTELKVKQRSYLVIVKQSIQHLLVVINDILDYAKLRSDKLDIEFLPSSLSNTIKETTDLLNRIAAQKGIKLHVHIDSDLHDSLKFDEVRMKQVLLNLISNAIKFTDKGSVTVNATFNGEQSGDAFLVITIIDTGIGISENNLQKIFNAFEQAEVSTTRKYGGSGLGLSITQRLVQLLNGTIQIESKEGIGTQVKLQFRFQFSEQTQPEAIEQRDETDIHSVLQHKNILIADDEEWNTNLLGTILEQYDVHYTVVKNGKDVIALLHQQLFDVILMDVRMPELNGFETTKSIRKMTKPYAEIPIIGLTADTSDAQLKLCSQAGMNAVLGKPFTELDLCRLIVQNLTQKNDSHEMNHLKKVKHEMQPEDQQELSQSYSLDILHKMSNEDEVFLIKMLGIFRDNGTKYFEQIKQGIEEKDFELVSDMAHKMAPSVRHLEASTLLTLLKQIEAKANQKDKINLIKLYLDAFKLFNEICSDIKQKYPSV